MPDWRNGPVTDRDFREVEEHSTPISVVIVEDDASVRERLAAVISAQPRFQLVASAGNLKAARAVVQQCMPQVLLLDLGLPDGNGIELIAELRGLPASPGVLVISVMGDESSVLAAIQAGAGGYLLKDSSDADVIAAVDQLLQGGAPLSPSIAVHLMRRLQAEPASGRQSMETALTEREITLLKLIAKGLSYSEVAVAMELRYNTVASYAKDLYRKLQVHGRAEAVYEAIQMGLVGTRRD